MTLAFFQAICIPQPFETTTIPISNHTLAIIDIGNSVSIYQDVIKTVIPLQFNKILNLKETVSSISSQITSYLSSIEKTYKHDANSSDFWRIAAHTIDRNNELHNLTALHKFFQLSNTHGLAKHINNHLSILQPSTHSLENLKKIKDPAIYINMNNTIFITSYFERFCKTLLDSRVSDLLIAHSYLIFTEYKNKSPISQAHIHDTVRNYNKLSATLAAIVHKLLYALNSTLVESPTLILALKTSPLSTKLFNNFPNSSVENLADTIQQISSYSYKLSNSTLLI